MSAAPFADRWETPVPTGRPAGSGELDGSTAGTPGPPAAGQLGAGGTAGCCPPAPLSQNAGRSETLSSGVAADTLPSPVFAAEPAIRDEGGPGRAMSGPGPRFLPRRDWCVVDGCESRVKAKGYCKLHYNRWRRTGDPTTTRKTGPTPVPLDEFMLARIAVVGDCWEFAVRNVHGYGIVARSGDHQYAHRVMYEAVVGPIPEGLQLDHLCRNPPCCNPAHLEPVTAAENQARKPVPTHCKHGHEFTEANTYLRPDNGARQCRACKAGERQPRERAVSCSRCLAPTWNDSAVCDDCGFRDHNGPDCAMKWLHR